jgi:hypothetical protein
MFNAIIKYVCCYNYFVGASNRTAINVFLAQVSSCGFPLSSDVSHFILQEMGFFNVTRQADQALKREKNYVTECHGRVVGPPASH